MITTNFPFVIIENFPSVYESLYFIKKDNLKIYPLEHLLTTKIIMYVGFP